MPEEIQLIEFNRDEEQGAEARPKEPKLHPWVSHNIYKWYSVMAVGTIFICGGIVCVYVPFKVASVSLALASVFFAAGMVAIAFSLHMMRTTIRKIAQNKRNALRESLEVKMNGAILPVLLPRTYSLERRNSTKSNDDEGKKRTRLSRSSSKPENESIEEDEVDAPKEENDSVFVISSKCSSAEIPATYSPPLCTSSQPLNTTDQLDSVILQVSSIETSSQLQQSKSTPVLVQAEISSEAQRSKIRMLYPRLDPHVLLKDFSSRSRFIRNRMLSSSRHSLKSVGKEKEKLCVKRSVQSEAGVLAATSTPVDDSDSNTLEVWRRSKRSVSDVSFVSAYEFLPPELLLEPASDSIDDFDETSIRTYASNRDFTSSALSISSLSMASGYVTPPTEFPPGLWNSTSRNMHIPLKLTDSIDENRIDSSLGSLSSTPSSRPTTSPTLNWSQGSLNEDIYSGIHGSIASLDQKSKRSTSDESEIIEIDEPPLLSPIQETQNEAYHEFKTVTDTRIAVQTTDISEESEKVKGAENIDLNPCSEEKELTTPENVNGEGSLLTASKKESDSDSRNLDLNHSEESGVKISRFIVHRVDSRELYYEQETEINDNETYLQSKSDNDQKIACVELPPNVREDDNIGQQLSGTVIKSEVLQNEARSVTNFISNVENKASIPYAAYHSPQKTSLETNKEDKEALQEGISFENHVGKTSSDPKTQSLISDKVGKITEHSDAQIQLTQKENSAKEDDSKVSLCEEANNDATDAQTRPPEDTKDDGHIHNLGQIAAEASPNIDDVIVPIASISELDELTEDEPSSESSDSPKIKSGGNLPTVLSPEQSKNAEIVVKESRSHSDPVIVKILSRFRRATRSFSDIVHLGKHGNNTPKKPQHANFSKSSVHSMPKEDIRISISSEQINTTDNSNKTKDDFQDTEQMKGLSEDESIETSGDNRDISKETFSSSGITSETNTTNYGNEMSNTNILDQPSSSTSNNTNSPQFSTENNRITEVASELLVECSAACSSTMENKQPLVNSENSEIKNYFHIPIELPSVCLPSTNSVQCEIDGELT